MASNPMDSASQPPYSQASGPLRVGELARRTGVSVRALHHYDEIGLLRPSRRTASGHRLYTEGDVVRLLRVRSLQQLGLSLDEIGAVLDDPASSPLDVVERHVVHLRDRIGEEQRLLDCLERLAGRLRREEAVPVGEFLQAIEEITMFEKYYTKDQLARLDRRAKEVGEDRIREVEAEWPKLIAEVLAEMQAGTDPASPRMRELAARWRALIDEFTGGDADIEASLGRLHQGEPQVGSEHGMDPDLMSFVGRAMRG